MSERKKEKREKKAKAASSDDDNDAAPARRAPPKGDGLNWSAIIILCLFVVPAAITAFIGISDWMDPEAGIDRNIREKVIACSPFRHDICALFENLTLNCTHAPIFRLIVPFVLKRPGCSLLFISKP